MLLQQHGISVSHEDIERVDTLRYLWQKLQSQVSERLTYLLQVQPSFKASLTENVKQFHTDVDQFVDEYNEVCSRSDSLQLMTSIVVCLCRKDQWLWGLPLEKHLIGL